MRCLNGCVEKSAFCQLQHGFTKLLVLGQTVVDVCRYSNVQTALNCFDGYLSINMAIQPSCMDSRLVHVSVYSTRNENSEFILVVANH